MPPSTLISHEYHREFPQVKSLNYMAGFRIQQQRVQAGAIDVLYHQKGLISETSRSNAFVVKDGVVFTPDQDVLQGITRNNWLKAMQSEFQVLLESVTTEQLWSTDEVFITSTIKEVLPIVKIDGQAVGNGKVGAVTERLQQIFRELI